MTETDRPQEEMRAEPRLGHLRFGHLILFGAWDLELGIYANSLQGQLYRVPPKRRVLWAWILYLPFSSARNMDISLSVSSV